MWNIKHESTRSKKRYDKKHLRHIQSEINVDFLRDLFVLLIFYICYSIMVFTMDSKDHN